MSHTNRRYELLHKTARVRKVTLITTNLPVEYNNQDEELYQSQKLKAHLPYLGFVSREFFFFIFSSAFVFAWPHLADR